MAVTISGTDGISGDLPTIKVSNGTEAAPALTGQDTDSGVFFGTNEVNISTNGSTAATVDSSGRLLVGTSTARSTFFNAALSQSLQIESVGSGNNRGALSIVSNSSTDDPGYIVLGRTAGTTAGATNLVSNGNWLGLVSFQGSDGTDMVECANIKAYVDGTPGSNDMPGRLVFSTTADGATTPTERMRITQEGIVKIGTTGSSTAGQNNANSLLVENSTKPASFYTTASSGYAAITAGRSNNGGVFESFFGTALVGSISVTSTATAYNTTSDYRLKENVVDLDGAITRVKQLSPKRFNFIADADTTVDGFLAHEAQTVVPEAVTGTHNEVDDDGNAVMQGIDQSKLVPLLTAALQEAIAKIETLETKVAALEAAS